MTDLSHQEFMQVSRALIQKLLSVDTVLDDLHPQISSDEIEALIELEHGQAFVIYVNRDSKTPWKLVVSNDFTVHQLKLALRKHVKNYLTRQGTSTTVSWKYIWRTYYLDFQGVPLVNCNKKLIEYGVTNKVHLNFLKKNKKLKY